MLETRQSKKHVKESNKAYYHGKKEQERARKKI